VRYAGVLAEFFGASVYLLHVVPCDAFTQNLQHLGLVTPHDEVIGTASRLLIKLIRAGPAAALRGQTLVRIGDPVQQIVEVAKAFGMDLVILSVGGDLGLKHPLSSGTAERVVGQQPCLTLTLRHELLAWDKSVPATGWKNILVPVDLTESSRLTVRWAATLAERLHAKVIIRYAPALLEESRGYKTSQRSPLQAKESRAIETRVAEWATLGVVGAVEVDPLPELERPDAHVLGQMVRRARSDLIVTGITRASWWHRLAHGGATEQLRRVAPCPVLSVPQDDWEYCAEEIAA
jgi:universal stress protein A